MRAMGAPDEVLTAYKNAIDALDDFKIDAGIETEMTTQIFEALDQDHDGKVGVHVL